MTVRFALTERLSQGGLDASPDYDPTDKLDFFLAEGDAKQSGNFETWTRGKTRDSLTSRFLPGNDQVNDWAEKITRDLEEQVGIRDTEVDEDGNPLGDDKKKKKKKKS